MEDSYGSTYLSVEKPFIDYFNRCKEIGMCKLDIQKNFRYLDKYYHESVFEKLSLQTIYKNDPTLDKLFNNWCKDNNIE